MQRIHANRDTNTGTGRFWLLTMQFVSTRAPWSLAVRMSRHDAVGEIAGLRPLWPGRSMAGMQRVVQVDARQDREHVSLQSRN